MKTINLPSIPEKEIVPGFHARFVHSDNMTIAHWRIDEGAALPEHAHVHEQVLNLLEGRFELTLDGQPHALEAGAVVVIPSNVSHGGKALTACRIIDIFHPVREDYKES